MGGTSINATWDGGTVTFATPVTLVAGDTLTIG
jgi:hypothetical protein